MLSVCPKVAQIVTAAVLLELKRSPGKRLSDTSNQRLSLD